MKVIYHLSSIIDEMLQNRANRSYKSFELVPGELAIVPLPQTSSAECSPCKTNEGSPFTITIVTRLTVLSSALSSCDTKEIRKAFRSFKNEYNICERNMKSKPGYKTRQ